MGGRAALDGRPGAMGTHGATRGSARTAAGSRAIVVGLFLAVLAPAAPLVLSSDESATAGGMELRLQDGSTIEARLAAAPSAAPAPSASPTATAKATRDEVNGIPRFELVFMLAGLGFIILVSLVAARLGIPSG